MNDAAHWIPNSSTLFQVRGLCYIHTIQTVNEVLMEDGVPVDHYHKVQCTSESDSNDYPQSVFAYVWSGLVEDPEIVPWGL